MASVIVSLRVMPVSPDADLKAIDERASMFISGFGGELAKKEVVPVAFGLNALVLHFVMDEGIGGTEELERRISSVEGVSSVEVVDVRRAVG